MKQPWLILLFVAACAISAALGFVAGQRSKGSAEAGQPSADGAKSSGAAARTPRETIERYETAVLRWQGPFSDPLEQLAATQKLEATKAEVLALGRPGFSAVVEVLGEPGKVPTRTPREEGAAFGPATDPVIREALVEVLPGLDATAAARDLSVRLLDDNESERVRAKCAGELAHLDRAAALPALVEGLDRASERAWNGCRALTEALGVLGGTAGEEALLRSFLKPTTTQELRIAAAQQLGLLRAQMAVGPLENTIRHEDRDHYVRREAVRALLRIDPERAKVLVTEQIDRESDAAFQEFLKSVAKDSKAK